eukprot:Amastigsp_a345351_13.p6 type:complete len:102 gc:universal Amastigsp_a345351_13:1315-1010(-)
MLRSTQSPASSDQNRDSRISSRAAAAAAYLAAAFGRWSTVAICESVFSLRYMMALRSIGASDRTHDCWIVSESANHREEKSHPVAATDESSENRHARAVGS